MPWEPIRCIDGLADADALLSKTDTTKNGCQFFGK